MDPTATVAAAVSAPTIDVSGVDFTQVFGTIQSLIPALLPVIIMFIAFRKGWAFLKGSLLSA